MNHLRLKYFASLAGAIICLVAGGYASAQSVDSVMQQDNARVQQAVKSQQTVDSISKQTDKVVSDYKVVLKQIENLRVYNAQLGLQIQDQENQLSDLSKSIDEATSMEVNLVPLQLQMVDALKQFIDMDLPFSLNERHQRVQRLEANMKRSDLSTAEKFRQILEAYRIETDYGKNVESYSDSINVDGRQLEVNILRVGRIALMYQTKDEAITGAWDRDTKKWVELDSGTYKNAVANGLRIAKQQAAIDIMSLPIPAPKG